MSNASVLKLTIRITYARCIPLRSAISVRFSATPDHRIASHTDRHIYPNPSAAKAVARAKLAAEKSVEVRGFKQEVDGTYLIESVTHQLAGQSWASSVEISDGKSGKAKAGHTKAPQRTTTVAIPSAP